VVVVPFDIVGSARVALRAEAVAGHPQCVAVGIVAVRADYARRIHPALQEGAINIDLVQYLAIGKIQAGLDQRQAMGIVEALAGVILVDFAAACVTACADLNLLVGPPLIGAGERVAGFVRSRSECVPVGE
jgi:hypothetical protein